MNNDAMGDPRTATYIRRLGLSDGVAHELDTVLGFHDMRELLCSCAMGGAKGTGFLQQVMGNNAMGIIEHLLSRTGQDALERTEMEVRISAFPRGSGGMRHMGASVFMSLLSPPVMPDRQAVENAMNLKFPRLSAAALCKAAMLRFHGVHPAYDEAIGWLENPVGAIRLDTLDRWCIVIQERIAVEDDEGDEDDR